MEKFRELGLSYTSLKAIEKKGFEEPTEIQSKTIPLLLKSNQDIIAQAQTGTGKTAAFGLVFVEKLKENQRFPQALVLTPTRELAVQVAEEINSLKGDKNLSVVPIYGGQSIGMQINQLKRGVDIIVGTPGRVLDHLKNKKLILSQLEYLVLDEADEMLNMGFIEDIEEIMNYSPSSKQMLLFSATMPKRILTLAKKYMPRYSHIEAEKKTIANNLVDQIYYEVFQRDKFEALCRIIDLEASFYSIIFCRTKVDVDYTSKGLNDRGYKTEALHGDIPQGRREQILKNFKTKKTMILVATDVAARGIDVNNLTHVINYALPQNPEAYVHRIGRTGRAGNQGTAITFITPDEYRRLSFIKKIAHTDIRREKVPTIKKIIELKKNKIAEDIQKIVAADDLDYYKELAESIVGKDIDKETALAALLKHTMAHEFDTSNYINVKEVSAQKPSSRKFQGNRNKKYSRPYNKNTNNKNSNNSSRNRRK